MGGGASTSREKGGGKNEIRQVTKAGSPQSHFFTSLLRPRGLCVQVVEPKSPGSGFSWMPGRILGASKVGPGASLGAGRV